MPLDQSIIRITKVRPAVHNHTVPQMLTLVI